MQQRSRTLWRSVALLVVLAAVPVAAQVEVSEQITPSASEGAGSGLKAHRGEEGGLVMSDASGNNRLAIGGWLQGRFDAVAWDDARNRGNTANFSVSRARLELSGNIGNKDNTFALQFAADSPDDYLSLITESESVTLHDAWIRHRFCDNFYARAGKFKVPFSRQQLASSADLQFPERAYATDTLGLDRRGIGIQGEGSLDKGKFGYAVAIVDRQDVNNEPTAGTALAFIGRATYAPSGELGEAEGDLEDHQELTPSLGAALRYQANYLGPIVGNLIQYTFDGGLKRRGLSLGAAFYGTHLDAKTGGNVDNESFYVQGGYFLSPKTLEVALRTGRVFYDGEGNDVSEYGVGTSWYCNINHLKLQAAYTHYSYEAGDRGDDRFTTQAQIAF